MRLHATRASFALLVALAAAALPAPAARGEEPAAPPVPRRAWEDLKLPPLRPFSAPKPERRVIDGMVVYLLEDHELPTVDLVAVVRAGSVYEPREKAGLAAICGEVMRTGGTPEKTGDEIDEELESMAAAVETKIDVWQGQLAVSALKENFDAALETGVRIITEPAFREDKIDLSKRQLRSAIARRNDDPGEIAGREYKRAIYGDESPYGWTAEVATVDAVTRQDLVDFHARFFRRERTIIGVVGDFDTDEMAKRIEAAFARYGRAGEAKPLPPDPVVRTDVPAKVYLVRKPEVNQSSVYLGHLGIRRRADDPDYFAAIVANTILGGGGFSSRLLQRVRTEMGLAYGVFSHLDAPYSHVGTFYMNCQTKSETTLRAIEAMKRELARVVTEPPSAAELEVAKSALLQSLVFASESRSDVIERAVRYEFYGFPQDYLERFQAGIAAVTADDVLRVAKKTFKPESLVTVVVGNDAAFDGKLESLGEVVVLDVTKPAWPKVDPAAAAAAANAPGAKEKAAAIIAKAVEAHGGRAALEAVKALRTRGKITLTQPGQHGALEMRYEALVELPNKLKKTVVTPMGPLTEASDGVSAWVVMPGGQPQDRGPGDLAKHEKEIRQDIVRTLLDLAANGGALQGEATIGGKKANVLLHDGRKVFFDPESGLIIGREADGVEIALDDHRPVAGVMLPHRWSGSQQGMSVEATVEEIVVNPEIPAGAFAKPAPAGGGKASAREHGREPAKAGAR